MIHAVRFRVFSCRTTVWDSSVVLRPGSSSEVSCQLVANVVGLWLFPTSALASFVRGLVSFCRAASEYWDRCISGLVVLVLLHILQPVAAFAQLKSPYSEVCLAWLFAHAGHKSPTWYPKPEGTSWRLNSCISIKPKSENYSPQALDTADLNPKL